jgi:hypothetical protein
VVPFAFIMISLKDIRQRNDFFRLVLPFSCAFVKDFKNNSATTLSCAFILFRFSEIRMRYIINSDLILLFRIVWIIVDCVSNLGLSFLG